MKHLLGNQPQNACCEQKSGYFVVIITGVEAVVVGACHMLVMLVFAC
jgi:hypothetical protein